MSNIIICWIYYLVMYIVYILFAFLYELVNNIKHINHIYGSFFFKGIITPIFMKTSFHKKRILIFEYIDYFNHLFVSLKTKYIIYYSIIIYDNIIFYLEIINKIII